VLALGDLAYNNGEKRSFECFDKTWGKFKSRILPVPGNHEYNTQKGAPYRDYFAAELKALNAHESLSTYALDFPAASPSAWRLVAINSNEETGAKQPQLQRLESELKEHKSRRCVLAFTHDFFYSSGAHGHNDAKDLNAPLVPLKDTRSIYPLLYKYRVTAFVAGHDHHFEQLGRANGKAKAADRGKSARAADGVRSFVVGTGGKFLYSDPYKNIWAFTEAYDLSSYGILKIELFKNSYRWQFIPTKDNARSLTVIKDVKQDTCNR
jgi:3',5'-cyclic AMP phosphodiesterase CpdA